MDKILGLDLGTNSIGWAIRNPTETENQIEQFGVVTFNKGVGIGKTGEYSYAAERTKKRSMRRLYQSRKYRLWATLERLIHEGFCPLSMESLDRWRHYDKAEALRNNNAGRIYPVDDAVFDQWIKLDFDGDGKPDYTSPYQLRKELAETALDLSVERNRHKLGRALYHIAQRRGFKSSRKGADDAKEKETADAEIVDLQYSERKENKTIMEQFARYPEAKTIGWLFALLEKNKVRVRENMAQHAIRENYKDEIRYIFDIQQLGLEHVLYQRLVETGRNKNDGSIFYKRPLRSQKGLIGKCTLEPSKYRAPVSHPDFELFRAWSFLNNIQYKQAVPDTNFKTNPNKPQKPDLGLLVEILNKLFFRKSKTYFPFSEIMDAIAKKGRKWQFNYTPKATVTGCPVTARLKDVFGDNYQNLRIAKAPSGKSGKDYYDLEDIWHVLFSYEDQEAVVEFVSEKLGLNPELAKCFIIAWNALPVGYGMLSLNAIRKINRYLQKGFIYTEAVLLANLPEVIGKEAWEAAEPLFLEHIKGIIDDNRQQKRILNIANNLVSQHKNLEQKAGYKNTDYKLDKTDHKDIEAAIEESFGAKRWAEKDIAERKQITQTVTDCYQAYFQGSALPRKDISDERHFEVESGGQRYYKTDSGFYRLPKLIDTLSEFIQANFEASDKQLQKIYHPSEISIYPPAKEDNNGIVKLGSPKTGSFKNPMAMRTLHELRKLLNYMIETRQIDSDTKVVVEVARGLNDANKRWAIEAWQKQREAENAEFANAINELVLRDSMLADSQSERDIDKMRLWYEQNGEESVPPLAELKKEVKGIKWNDGRKDSYKLIAAQKAMVDKYRLWKEQECRCLYTGDVINITDLFNENVIDFEHTIPRSISFDNTLANKTVTYASFNRTVKKKQIPFTLGNYDEILGRLDKWKEKVARIEQQIDFWKTKSKKASDKSWKDDAIRQRHLWQMELEYWKAKLDRFTMEEVTSGFKNSQKVDTQLISKYALHYLKSYFEKVDVQKGSITAEFRKMFGLQVADEKKDRSKHSHHAKDAAVLTLIPVAAKRDELLKTYYEHKEKHQGYTTEPYKGFKREYVWCIDDDILINNVAKDKSLIPIRKKIRKRGKETFIPGTDKVKWATGDSIRGQLHQETFYGAIKPAKRDEKGAILKDEEGNKVLADEPRYVLRIPFQYKKDTNTPGFKTLEDIKKQIVDEGLKAHIEKQVAEAGGLKEAFEKGIHLLDKAGNKVGNPIRHIRVWASVSEPLKIKKQTNLSKAEYKQHYYAANATNSYFAIYKSEGKTAFKHRNLREVAHVVTTGTAQKPEDLFAPTLSLIKGRKTAELELWYILMAGRKVIFLAPDETVREVSALAPNELSRRLYVFTNYEKDGRLNFKHHLEARAKFEESYAESELVLDAPKPTLRFSYAKHNFLVDGYDFTVEMNGKINWKRHD